MIGFGKRLSYAFKSFFGILASGEIPPEVAEELVHVPPQAVAPAPERLPEVPPAPVVESADRAVQMLAILQRDGRLIDFFTEDISPYTDAQVGAAVRELQQSCRQSLERYIRLEPIIASEEGQPVTIQEAIDPAAIKLIGNITGKLPLHGLLRHRGWQVSAVNLPPLPDAASRSVVAPAEVEIS